MNGGQEGRGRTALVTGASSGIGAAFADHLGARGYGVILIARRRERLDQNAAAIAARYRVNAQVIVADLMDPDAPRAIFEEANGSVDFLVNNAAISQPGDFADIEWEQHRGRMQLMAIAPMELAHRAIPGMIEAGWGRIVNVGSISAYMQGAPREATYVGIKTLIHSFSESLAAELRDTCVRCTLSVPGFTDTEIFDGTEIRAEIDKRRLYQAAMMSPATVAQQAYAAAIEGRPAVIHGLHHRAMAAVLSHLPLPLRRRAVYTLMTRMESGSL